MLTSNFSSIPDIQHNAFNHFENKYFFLNGKKSQNIWGFAPLKFKIASLKI